MWIHPSARRTSGKVGENRKSHTPMVKVMINVAADSLELKKPRRKEQLQTYVTLGNSKFNVNTTPRRIIAVEVELSPSRSHEPWCAVRQVEKAIMPTTCADYKFATSPEAVGGFLYKIPNGTITQ